MNFLRFSKSFWMLLCLLAMTSGCVQKKQQDPEKILREMIQASSNANYTGVKSFEQRVGNQFFRFRMKVSHQAPDNTRLEFLEPAPKKGQVVIAHGRESWKMESPDTSDGSVHFRNVASYHGMEIRNVGLLLQNYEVRYEGTESVANRTADVIGIVSGSQPSITRRVWIDHASRLPLKSEENANTNGEPRVKRYCYEEIKFVGRLADTLFSIPMHPGSRSPLPQPRADNISLEDAKQRAPFLIHAPEYLPKGFILEQISWLEKTPSGFLHFHYSDGMMALSLFEENAANFQAAAGNRIYRMRSGPITVLRRTCNGTHATLVGEVAAEEMVKMMSSLKSCE